MNSCGPMIERTLFDHALIELAIARAAEILSEYSTWDELCGLDFAVGNAAAMTAATSSFSASDQTTTMIGAMLKKLQQKTEPVLNAA